jgi:hypothetical protein
MQGILQRTLSPATIIALVALLIATAGTSYAIAKLPRNSVGTPQLKNNAVTTAKLATTASARIAGLTYKRSNIIANPRTGGVIDVPCPSGLTAIAGGVETKHTFNAFLLDSHPTATGWETSVGNPSDAAEPITAYVICATVESGRARAATATATVRRFALEH